MDPNTRALTMGAAAGGAGAYIEDVFSTYLYTGTGSAQTITNGIDLANKGGSIFFACRDTNSVDRLNVFAASPQSFPDNPRLFTNSTAITTGASFSVTSFNNNGFSLAAETGSFDYNFSGKKYVSWTFRKAAKFFDVVTYTGNGTSQSIAHNLGSEPGFVIIKATSTSGNWVCYHRSLGTGNAVFLNLTNASTAASDISAVSSTTFSVSGSQPRSNESGQTYVAYLFAHDAGGFGDSGNESVVKCGSYEPDGTSNFAVDLGWEPQWLMIKTATNSDNYNGWAIFDNMRGVATGGKDPILFANQSWAEDRGVSGVDISLDYVNFTSTGFTVTSGANSTGATFRTYIYIAIRRGPMKTPTDATKVFTAANATSNGTTTTWTTNFPVDLALFRLTAFTQSIGFFAHDRIRGEFPYDFGTASTAAETNTSTKLVNFDLQTTFTERYGNTSSRNLILEAFRRAPGFFDVVAYTGTGSVRTVAHNLGVAPELMLIKSRNDAYQWMVFASALGATQYLTLNSTIAAATESTIFNNTLPTASLFTLGTNATVNSGLNYIAYLFASCPGVSKVGSYTGTGTTLNIDCGFTNGARFVLVKRTDSSGDWYVWDTTRGIVAGNDPFLRLNNTGAEVVGNDWIDPLNSGFQISSTAPVAVNASGGSFIFLAIA